MGLTVGLLAATVLAAQVAKGSALRVENDTIDVGKVIGGQPALATYVFHNDGSTDIRILRASPS
jgi:hypothetical protein